MITVFPRKSLCSPWQKLYFFLFPSLLWSAVLAAESAVPAEGMPPVPLPAALERVLRDYETAWREKDAAALASLFTEDGFVLSSNRPPVRGQAAIKAAYAEAGGSLYLRAIAFEVSEPLAYIVGAYRFQVDGPDHGKFLLTLRLNSDGLWEIAADMDNPNQ